ncbi:probable protein disulfide-isomerase A4 [Eurytemora carolleeae]|uniref:probable protein disulfide-isomerase A4 n=1 Tax=Eurytemora carolleeae TaxID=1294199 RepID=UPI000C75E507|nr:probable protein disulfide-isomerase A4 [Eurytemora carolleeae]|eukprot:XP_023336039.1 probable protein disulfide-isomerase A4 [Eurytemora affinis]
MKAPRGNYNIIKDEEVYVLTRDTFAFFVKNRDLVLVEFYAPWCGHCKTLEPEYAKAAKELLKEGIPLAKVDATKEGELAKEYFVQGFPTLLLFKNGNKVEDYTGSRTSGEIVDYMRKQADPNWSPPPSVILTLSQDNFTKVAKTKDLMLTMFYAPWCKHCKQLEPEFEGAAQELQEWGIVLSKVNKETTQLEATVVGFFKGKSDLFDEYLVAANEMRGLFRFLHTTDTDRFLHTTDPDRFLHNTDTALYLDFSTLLILIGFSTLLILIDFSTILILFLHTTDTALAKEFGFPPDTVTVFQPEIYHSPYENKTFSFTKKSGTYKEIIQFVRKSSIPLVGQRTRTNLHKYSERPLIVLYYDVNFDHQFVKDTQFVREKVLKVAKYFIDSNLRFALSNEEEFEDELKALGLEDSGADVNVACYTDKQKFRMAVEEDFEPESLGNFVEGLRTGKVKPFMKSLPVPKRQDSIIRKIVADNYDEEIHMVKKDAVLFFYAPWCGHCKEMDPVLKKVAKKITKTNENIVFGKIDGTVNDKPYMFPNLKGYPSLFFISAYEKYDPILYQGDKSYKSVKDWINRHSSIFLTDDEKNGDVSLDDDELPELPETIESFQTENIEESMKKKPEEIVEDETEKNPKDEL